VATIQLGPDERPERLNRQVRGLAVRREGSRPVFPIAAQRAATGAALARN